MAKKKESAIPKVVFVALEVLGYEVGDYGRPYIWVLTKTSLWRVKLEGWGRECVPGEACEAAHVEAEKLAKAWRYDEDETGFFRVDGGEVWAMTWAVSGPFPRSARKQIADEDIIEV